MADKITLRTSVDVFVTPTQAARYGVQRLYVNSEAQAYLFFNLPTMPLNSVILSATLVGFSGGDLAALTSGFPTVTLHTVEEHYNANVLTWDTRPDESAAVETETAPTDADTDRWEWDVTAEMLTAISTGVWYGLTLKGDGALGHYFWSSTSSYPMFLEMEWTAPPPVPTSLHPAEGFKVNSPKPTLSWNGGTSGANEKPYSIQVQVANDQAMSVSLWDSGERVTQAMMLDLNTTTFPAIPSGGVRWWRVRTKNTSGLWSPWSNPVSFSYLDPGVLTITAPATTITTPTPTLTWTFTGATQQAFQVITTGYGETYDSGIIYTTDKTYTFPQGIWDYNNDGYTITLRVWDTNDRIDVSTVPNWSQASRFVVFNGGATPPPVQITIQEYAPGYPHQLLKWRYNGPAATSFAIIRWRFPGDPAPIIHWTTPAATAVPGQPEWFQFADGFVAGRNEVTWQVRVVANNIMSSSEPTVSKTVDHMFPWVIHVNDLSRRFCLVNYSIDPGLSEVTDVVQPIGGPAFIVNQQYKGYIGTATGIMANGVVSGLTARQMKDNFMWLRKNPHVYLVWADEAVQCYIYDSKIVSIPTADGSTDYGVSFGFIEIARAS
jgi:hypothetical protein